MLEHPNILLGNCIGEITIFNDEGKYTWQQNTIYIGNITPPRKPFESTLSLLQHEMAHWAQNIVLSDDERRIVVEYVLKKNAKQVSASEYYDDVIEGSALYIQNL